MGLANNARRRASDIARHEGIPKRSPAAPTDAEGLTTVNPIFTWVRLAQASFVQI